MAYQIPVYKAEREAGLEQAIRANACIALASAVRMAEKGELSERAVARLRSLAHQHTKAAQGDFDLFHLTTILVTVGWNRNDDVFDPVETWVARRTPEDKQLNYEHDDAKVIGHITSNWVMDAEGKLVPDDTVVDDLPAKFHIVTAGVLYKQWQTPELQERMDTLIAEIAEGKWFVSMECLFKGFDYALKASDGSTRIVARNEKTAFLSKHLRCYGGTGQYGDYKVGRMVRNIVFSGKGMVKNPANPESVILSADTENFSSATAQLVTDFSSASAEQVYVPAQLANTQDRSEESTRAMTLTVEQLQAQVAALTAENDKLKASATESALNDIKAKLETATAAEATAKDLLAKANTAITDLTAQVTAAKAETAKVQAELDEAKKALAEASDELKGLYAAKAKAARVALVKEKLGVEDADAAEFVEANEALNDEAFEKQVNFVAKTVAAKAPPKSTPAPTAPKATDKPAPMAGKAGVEDDKAGEAAADATDLSTAAAGKPDATLSTSVTDSGVTDLQRSIAALFGYKADESAE